MSEPVAALSHRGTTRLRHNQRTLLVVDDYGDAVGYMRRCVGCAEWWPLREEHWHPTARKYDALGFHRVCRSCKGWRTRRRARTDEARRLARANHARRKIADPDYVARRRTIGRRANARHYAKLRRDPQAWRRMLEDARIAYRLRAERAGRIVTRRMHDAVGAYRAANGSHGLDPLPLQQWLETVIADAERRDVDFAGLCRELGAQDRQLRAVRAGEWATVSLSTADSLLTNYGRPVVIRSRDLERRLVDWAEELPGNGTRLLAYMDRAEAVAHLADVAVMRLDDLWPELDA